MQDASQVSQMISLARGRDAAAVSRLLAAYRNYLKVLAQLWVARDLPAKLDPSDLVQETLLKAHERFEQFQGASEIELTAWLRKILSRCVVDVVRQYQAAAREVGRERSLEQSFAHSAEALNRVLGAGGSTPSQQASRRELGVVLADALAALPDDQRQVVTLRSLRGQAWAEVAAELDRSVSAVRRLWIQGLDELRTRLEESN